MNFRRQPRFDKNFAALDGQSQKAIKKALRFLAHDWHHPSLRTKKMEGWDYIFEASANMDIRLTFHFEKPDTIVLRNCGHHDRTLKNP
ncbi:cytotoxin [Lentibacillus cibarius]|uniref:Cytotoxin n=1 Tax=Lentibacillus cibarius TaxID=2583219 RepID=A0A5S3QJQ2_9BACI|nr:cytotoxin [Lentibacillus cibarius]RYG71262.1 cytotoxin [Lentibacillus lipolyticus]TMN18805.1 cytotoxin [Lentibacillus cibarius]TMN18833.1 cytotoxin [Lentibacillus cibarius]